MDPDSQENLKSLFNKRLNDKIYTTFKELFSNTNIDSVHKRLPKIKVYNNEIARFMEDINVKYEISLNYTQKVQKYITGQKHFKYQLTQPISQNTNNHKPPQVPATEPHSESPHHPLPSLVEQQ